MDTPASPNRTPAGVPTGGQFAACAHAESDVSLADIPAATGVASISDLPSHFRSEIDALERRWRDEADVNDTFNGFIANLGERVLTACADDRPGYTELADAVACLREQMADPEVDEDDAAEEVIYCLQDITETAVTSPARL